MRKTIALLLLLVLPSVGCATCGQSALCTFKGTINDPANRTLRRSILATGLSTFCAQMLSHNAPLKMSADSPVIGRFYPQACTQKALDNGDLYVEFSGAGYGYTNVSKKMSFFMAGAVEYNQDFLIAKNECDVYAYFRPKQIRSSDFRVNKIEQPVASFLNALSPVADSFGKQLVGGKLAEGLTVIHDHDGNDDVGLGIIELGQRPPHPYDVHGASRVTYENLRTEVHQNQREFIGPIEIDGSGRALYFTGTLDGAAAIDVFFMRKEEAEASLRLYLDYPASGPLAAPPMLADVMQAGVELKRTVPLPKGMYYVVLDNTPSAGTVSPPMNLFDDRAAVVNYVIQVGDAP